MHLFVCVLQITHIKETSNGYPFGPKMARCFKKLELKDGAKVLRSLPMSVGEPGHEIHSATARAVVEQDYSTLQSGGMVRAVTGSSVNSTS